MIISSDGCTSSGLSSHSYPELATFQLFLSSPSICLPGASNAASLRNLLRVKVPFPSFPSRAGPLTCTGCQAHADSASRALPAFPSQTAQPRWHKAPGTCHSVDWLPCQEIYIQFLSLPSTENTILFKNLCWQSQSSESNLFSSGYTDTGTTYHKTNPSHPDWPPSAKSPS